MISERKYSGWTGRIIDSTLVAFREELGEIDDLLRNRGDVVPATGFEKHSYPRLHASSHRPMRSLFSIKEQREREVEGLQKELDYRKNNPGG